MHIEAEITKRVEGEFDSLDAFRAKFPDPEMRIVAIDGRSVAHPCKECGRPILFGEGEEFLDCAECFKKALDAEQRAVGRIGLRNG